MPRRHERLLCCPIQFACLCTAKDKNARHRFWHQINFKHFQLTVNLNTKTFRKKKMLEISKESVIQTLLDHGGRMPQKQLSAIYKPLLADKTQRPLFQKIVNQVAFVKTKEENGEAVKVVFLKKELRSRFVSKFLSKVAKKNSSPSSASVTSSSRGSPGSQSRVFIPDAIRYKNLTFIAD